MVNLTWVGHHGIMRSYPTDCLILPASLLARLVGPAMTTHYVSQ